MDEKLSENIKSILSSECNLASAISSILTENNVTKQKIPAQKNKEEIIKSLLPYLDEKSKKCADYILAAIRIAEIITDLKNKYS